MTPPAQSQCTLKQLEQVAPTAKKDMGASGNIPSRSGFSPSWLQTNRAEILSKFLFSKPKHSTS